MDEVTIYDSIWLFHTPSTSLGKTPFWNNDNNLTASIEKEDHFIMLWRLYISDSSPWGRIVKDEGPISINR